MARIEYGVLLVAVAALSFQLGTSFGTNAPPVAEPSPFADASRLAALERRVEGLASARATTVASSTPAMQRDVVDTASPAVAETLVGLREAVWSLARTQPQASFSATTPPPTNLAAVQVLLAGMTANGRIDNSDLLMMTAPQVLGRLGRPTKVYDGGAHNLVLVFEHSGAELHVQLKDGWVYSVSGCKQEQ